MRHEMLERWIRECAGSDVGLWWLADDVRETMQNGTEEDVRRATMPVIRALLTTQRVRAVTLVADGKYLPWQGSLEEQLARIDAEWAALGRPPQIGEVVWFIGLRGPGR